MLTKLCLIRDRDTGAFMACVFEAHEQGQSSYGWSTARTRAWPFESFNEAVQDFKQKEGQGRKIVLSKPED